MPEIRVELVGFQAIIERLDRIEARLDSLNGDAEWLDVPAAAVYVGMSEVALRSAERSKKVRAYRNASGRLRFRRSDLDSYSTGDDAA